MLVSHGIGRRISRWTSNFMSRSWRAKLRQHGRPQHAARRRRQTGGSSTRLQGHAMDNGASTTARSTGGAPGRSQMGTSKSRVTSNVLVEAPGQAPELNGKSMHITMAAGIAGNTTITTHHRPRARGGGLQDRTFHALRRCAARSLPAGRPGNEYPPWGDDDSSTKASACARFGCLRLLRGFVVRSRCGPEKKKHVFDLKRCGHMSNDEASW